MSLYDITVPAFQNILNQILSGSLNEPQLKLSLALVTEKMNILGEKLDPKDRDKIVRALEHAFPNAPDSKWTIIDMMVQLATPAALDALTRIDSQEHDSRIRLSIEKGIDSLERPELTL